MVRVILESGADAQHRIIYNHHEDPKNEKLDGPTLLHVVLAKKADNEIEEDVPENYQIIKVIKWRLGRFTAKASDTKVSKKAGKLKKDEKSSTKPTGKSADDVEDYRQAVDLVTECARLIYIRWLQSKLMKELIVTIDRYKHRHWYMILKSCQGTLSTGLWISPQRCLEIWDILSDTKKRIYNDKRIMTHALSIVLFLSWQNYGRRTSNVAPDTILTTQVNDAIEADVSRLLLQHKADKKMKTSMLQLKLNYLKPELVQDVSI
ncbi:jg13149 [Pararge aegeria aegeria]|nr:jg13149 [Pararge aegeria aegeria]